MKFRNWGPTTIWHNIESVAFFQNHSTLMYSMYKMGDNKKKQVMYCCVSYSRTYTVLCKEGTVEFKDRDFLAHEGSCISQFLRLVTVFQACSYILCSFSRISVLRSQNVYKPPSLGQKNPEVGFLNSEELSLIKSPHHLPSCPGQGGVNST